MRSEFSKWFERYENNNEYAAKLIAKDAYELGIQHQQSKVDELQNNINLLKEALDIKEQLNQKLREREDELQKRVDALEKAEFKLAQVKAILQNNPKLLESILVKKIEQAIKGEQP